ncbi:peptidyl-tRNA hydrolase ICT1, mitochondrial-like [Drosophila subpulchrella]|uniref:peptidyl-tRNA hydrolase ICT1, mitochondrial n=1 Tax=Drosophila subpulchrella TaxID=1486046 RepID=UPI0018A16D7E|nr:peptidyl-tRNA hydrolase ICT1, mitochondrial [Drosophila subpulchrella]XP_037709731.1 peptidyl-tRNA hydrolase ICT1, mitochondrial-like [Drosophila subpulchrella]
MNKITRAFISVLRQSSSSGGTNTLLGRQLSYKSDLSLEKLYPSSRLQIYTPPPPPPASGNKFNGFIPMDRLEVTYSRSSGPGGQHVNTVNTKVDVRFKVAQADWIPEQTRQKLLKVLANRITKEGYFYIKSDLTRSQQMNLADALEKLRTIIRSQEALEATPPSEETLEKLRRRHERAARERLQLKRGRAQVKADRQGPSGIDL